MTDTIHREPAVITGVLVSLLNLLIVFGVPLTGDQKEALVAFATTVLVLAGALLVRSQVSPTPQKPKP